jgi:hypothetical protein
VQPPTVGPDHGCGGSSPLGLARTTSHHAAAALALAALAQRRTEDGNTGVIAAPAVLLLAAVSWSLPHPAALIVMPTDVQWTASHHPT